MHNIFRRILGLPDNPVPYNERAPLDLFGQDSKGEFSNLPPKANWYKDRQIWCIATVTPSGVTRYHDIGKSVETPKSGDNPPHIKLLS